MPAREQTAPVRRHDYEGGHGAWRAALMSRVWALEHQSHLVLAHAVGDFVATGEALVTVYRGSGDLGASERELGGMIALGDERSIEQDPAFAIRIMVDIALTALSPAVNAPTTATQVARPSWGDATHDRGDRSRP